eukprot:720566_1
MSAYHRLACERVVRTWKRKEIGGRSVRHSVRKARATGHTLQMKRAVRIWRGVVSLSVTSNRIQHLVGSRVLANYWVEWRARHEAVIILGSAFVRWLDKARGAIARNAKIDLVLGAVLPNVRENILSKAILRLREYAVFRMSR